MQAGEIRSKKSKNLHFLLIMEIFTKPGEWKSDYCLNIACVYA